MKDPPIGIQIILNEKITENKKLQITNKYLHLQVEKYEGMLSKINQEYEKTQKDLILQVN